MLLIDAEVVLMKCITLVPFLAYKDLICSCNLISIHDASSWGKKKKSGVSLVTDNELLTSRSSCVQQHPELLVRNLVIVMQISVCYLTGFRKH